MIEIKKRSMRINKIFTLITSAVRERLKRDIHRKFIKISDKYLKTKVSAINIIVITKNA